MSSTLKKLLLSLHMQNFLLPRKNLLCFLGYAYIYRVYRHFFLPDRLLYRSFFFAFSSSVSYIFNRINPLKKRFWCCNLNICLDISNKHSFATKKAKYIRASVCVGYKKSFRCTFKILQTFQSFHWYFEYAAKTNNVYFFFFC